MWLASGILPPFGLVQGRRRWRHRRGGRCALVFLAVLVYSDSFHYLGCIPGTIMTNVLCGGEGHRMEFPTKTVKFLLNFVVLFVMIIQMCLSASQFSCLLGSRRSEIPYASWAQQGSGSLFRS